MRWSEPSRWHVAHTAAALPLPGSRALHPPSLRVMFAVQGFKAQTAAVLHDVLEDTEVNVDQLRQARWHTIVLPAT